MDKASFDKKVLPAAIDFIAGSQPGRIAIEHGENTFTYGELEKFSDQLAHCLLEEGLSSGEPAGLFLPGSIDYVAGILGVNKAGGIFMPLDVSYPKYRLGAILDQVRPAIILTNALQLEALTLLLGSLQDRAYTILVIDPHAGMIAAGKWTNARLTVAGARTYPSGKTGIVLNGEQSNYLLFTSGSTGIPKAIEGCHKSLSHFIHWEIGEFLLDNNVRVSQLAPLLFDVSLRDIFVPLLAGGTLVIPPAEVKGRPERLAGWIEEAGITVVHTVPSLFRILTDTVRKTGTGPYSFTSLQFVLLAGEPLYGRDVEEWSRHTDGLVTLVNLYGPSETTLAKVFHRICPGTYAGNTIIPLGQPIANTRVLILKNGKLCEVGETGEIYIKTPFMSKGYYRDETLTRARFVQNPLQDGGPDIIYKTGDIGRYGKDRRVEYIGREDNQVKIRGNRVELYEVETAIRNYVDISQVVLTVMQNTAGELQIVCYYLEQDTIDTAALRVFLKDYVPDYMIPSYFVGLKDFPLHINGKVNKQLLPRPEELLYENSKYVAPRNSLEEKLAAIWSKTLNIQKVGIDHSFFDLGGHSLSATKVVAAISQSLGKEVQIRDFLDHPTISSLAAFIMELNETSFESIPHLPLMKYYELSSSQRRLWIMEHLEGDLVSHNIQAVYELEGPLQTSQLERAFAMLAERHESLRTVFRQVDNEPVQIINGQPLPATAFFVRQIPEGPGQIRQARVLLREEAETRFDLTAGPLYKATVLSLGKEKYFFSFTIHHIISDAWSMHVLIKEAMLCYEACCRNTLPGLPELPVQYKDFAVWQKDRLEQLPVKEYIAGLQDFIVKEKPALELAGSGARPVIRSGQGKTLRRKIAPQVRQGLLEAGNEQGVSLFMNLLAAVNILLFRYSGQQDIIVGSTFAGREHADLKDQVGFFVNTLPLYTCVRREDLVADVVGQVRDRMLQVHAVQSYPLDRLLNDLQVKRTLHRSPLFDILVEFHFTEQLGTELAGIAVHRVEPEEIYSHFDLSFRFEEMGDELFVALNYSTDLFSGDYILRLAVHLDDVLAQMLANRYIQVGDIMLEGGGVNYRDVHLATDFDF